MLEITDLTAGYAQHTVLNGLSLSLECGSLLAVLGASGCGKTTLLHTLAGILAPSGGRMLLDDVPISPQQIPTALIPQEYGLLPWKTVRQNCLFCLSQKQQMAENSLPELTAQLGITDLLDRYPDSISGGQRQRAALLRALLFRPVLLLLDEPFAALDAGASLNAQMLLLALLRQQKMTTLIVTHRLEEALFLADQIAVMHPDGYFALQTENHWNGKRSPADPAFFALRARLLDAITHPTTREANP